MFKQQAKSFSSRTRRAQPAAAREQGYAAAPAALAGSKARHLGHSPAHQFQPAASLL